MVNCILSLNENKKFEKSYLEYYNCIIYELLIAHQIFYTYLYALQILNDAWANVLKNIFLDFKHRSHLKFVDLSIFSVVSGI